VTGQYGKGIVRSAADKLPQIVTKPGPLQRRRLCSDSKRASEVFFKFLVSS